jgi:biotin carboxylase
MAQEVIIVESNSAGNGVYAINYIRELGYKTHFITNTPHKYEKMKVNPMEIADRVTLIDTIDTIKLLHFFEDKRPLAIMTFDDFHIIPTSIVAQAHGLVHPDINGIINVRFKDKARQKTKFIGKSIKFKVMSVNDAGDRSPIGIPCVVKPVDESGSVGVKVCFSDNEYREAIETLKKLDTNITGYKYRKEVLVEEYIEGDEYSAEMIWDRNKRKWRILGFTKKFVSSPPYCIEVGHVFPYSFGYEQDSYILRIIESWLSSINLNNCAAHIEFKICDNEPVLIEINPRPAGGFINELVRLVKGRDLVSAYVDMHLNRPFDEEFIQSNGKYAAIKFILPPKPGIINDIRLPKKKIEGIIGWNFPDNKRVVEQVTSGDDRLGNVIAIGSSLDEAVRRAQEFVDNVDFEYSPSIKGENSYVKTK